MIPTLLYLLIRRFNKKYPGSIRKHLLLAIKIFAPVLVGLFACKLGLAQERLLAYDVFRNGKNVGSVTVSCSSQANKNWYRLQSRIRMRFLLTFLAEANEQTISENGVITYSSLYRKLNGNEKANKEHFLKHTGYELRMNDKTEPLHYRGIENNILTLYYREPHSVNKVYSDNYQQYLDIFQSGDHSYRLVFPDGTYNIYYYKEDICSAIDIHHSLYHATIKLKQYNRY